MTDFRLLLIDDDEDAFVLVRDFIADSDRGWTVDWAPTYEAGVERLANGAYDAALLDHHLGSHTGVELLASVQTMEDLPPIVLLTGQGDRTIDLAAMATGAADYLDKGMLSAALLERTVRHATERARTAAELRASEAKYRSLFQRAGDAVLIADDSGRYVDANPAACALLGVTREQAIGRTFVDFVEPTETMADPTDAWKAFLAAGEMRGQVCIRRPDGSTRDADFLATANYMPGRHLSILRDITERLAAEAELLASEERFRLLAERSRDVIFKYLTGAAKKFEYLSPSVQELSGYSPQELYADRRLAFGMIHPDDRREFARRHRNGSLFTGPTVCRWIRKDGAIVWAEQVSLEILDANGRRVAIEGVVRDVTARVEAAGVQARLVAAVEQTAESIVVTDAAGRAVYANPAFETMSGRAAADVLGGEPWAFLQTLGPASASRRMARRLTSGKTWTGDLSLLHRAGTTYREQVAISPVRDQTGKVVSFVSVGRDVTHLREIEASLDVNTRERAAFAHALARLEQRETPEETAQDITDAVTELPGVDSATLFSFADSEETSILGLTALHGSVLTVGMTLPAARSDYLRARAQQGPWAERWKPGGGDGGYGASLAAAGLLAVAYAPIGSADAPIGLIALGTREEGAAKRIEGMLPAATEFAAAAKGLISGALVTRQARRASRRKVEGIISAGEFGPVFQPIVNLISGVPVGFEALTRFTDGTRPDWLFAEAGTSGMGLELETATLERVMVASRDLPAGPWLSINVSPALVLEGERLARILEHRTRPIVLEITEHDSIDDYASVRAALQSLGPDVRVAVDDAGAGVANFTHLVELRPDYVKIDMGLVRGVNHDVTRQALIVGLRHFAGATNGWVIAEGVETEEERSALIGLELTLAQGYLFGRPQQAGSCEMAFSTRRPTILSHAG